MFEISGDMVAPEISQNMMTLIAEGAGEEDLNADLILRQHAVELYTRLLDKPYAKLPSALIETIAWVLGEYAYISGDFTIDEILMKLCTLTRKGKTLTPMTRKIVVTAIMKLVAQAGTCPPLAAKVIDDFTKSEDLDLQQRCLEFQTMLTSAPNILGDVLPIDASCEDIQVDINLSFLDAFVRSAISNGAKLYDKPEDDDDDDYDLVVREQSKPSAFKMTPYAKPTLNPSTVPLGQMKGVGSNTNNSYPTTASLPPGGYGMGENPPQNLAATPSTVPTSEPQLVLRNVATVWGKANASQAPTSVVPTPAPTTNSWSQPSAATGSVHPTPTSFIQPSVTPPTEPIKTEEQLRKERMAAALFGGAMPGTTVPSTTTTGPKRPLGRTSVASQPASMVPSAPLTAATPIPSASAAPSISSTIVQPPTPILEVDLLGFDSPPSSTVAESGTRSAPSLDPFSASGLLGDLGDSTTHKAPFIYLGSKLTPLSITTAEFGQRWGSFPFTSPSSIKSTKVKSLTDFMKLCESIGAHPVEAIAATNEGICAGIVSGSVQVLIHGKVSSSGDTSKLDITMKSNDANICGILAMHLQSVTR